MKMTEAPGIEAAMAKTPVLERTPSSAVSELARGGVVRRYRRGTYLFHQHDESPELFFLHDGRVEISSVAPSGDRQLHTAIEPPTFFGELGVLSGNPRTTSALAIEDSTVWALAGDRFLRFIASEPEAALGLLRALARQVEAQGSLVDDLLFLDLRGRLAKRLLGLVSPTLDELPGDGAVVPSIVTHADLASLAGGTRESVTRVLSEFQKRGLVERTGRRYVLRNVRALARLAGL